MSRGDTYRSQRKPLRRGIMREAVGLLAALLVAAGCTVLGAGIAQADEGAAASSRVGSGASSEVTTTMTEDGSDIELIPATSREEVTTVTEDGSDIELIPATSREEAAPTTSGTVGLPMAGTSSTGPTTTTDTTASTTADTAALTPPDDDAAEGITVLGASSEIVGESGGSGVPVGLWLGLGALVLIGAAAIVAARLRRTARH